jgi:predicted O-linked N-acetylglucosamine transferase (SPINDLY family)
MAANPRLVEIDNNRAETLLMMGRQEEALAAYQRLIAVRPQLRCARDGYLYALQMVEHDDPQLVFHEHQRWDRDFGLPLATCIRPHANDRSPKRRLRVGYVSSDLRAHPVAYFFENLLEHHDRAAVEVFCYAGLSNVDAMTERLRRKSDHWREVQGYSDDRLASRVRDDAIDILVDLNGHTMGSRLTTFARKPAPVQVTYLGYPATTGLSAMDYRLTDAHADPAGDADTRHSEKLVRLPDTFLCWRAPDESPPAGVREVPLHGITFASFNALPKVSPATIALWAAILGRRPDSRLMIKAIGLNDAGTRQGLLEKFARHGIADNRLLLVDRLASLQSHLAYYQQVDVGLDTSPYGGTTTTCEALWMGVPVVTLAGKVHAGRVGVSILNTVGLADLVAARGEEYVAKALSLAADAARRQELRAGLRERLRTSALMDAARFAREVERAYRQMWHRWCAETAMRAPAS